MLFSRAWLSMLGLSSRWSGVYAWRLLWWPSLVFVIWFFFRALFEVLAAHYSTGAPALHRLDSRLRFARVFLALIV